MAARPRGRRCASSLPTYPRLARDAHFLVPIACKPLVYWASRKSRPRCYLIINQSTWVGVRSSTVSLSSLAVFHSLSSASALTAVKFSGREIQRVGVPAGVWVLPLVPMSLYHVFCVLRQWRHEKAAVGAERPSSNVAGRPLEFAGLWPSGRCGRLRRPLCVRNVVWVARRRRTRPLRGSRRPSLWSPFGPSRSRPRPRSPPPPPRRRSV